MTTDITEGLPQTDTLKLQRAGGSSEGGEVIIVCHSELLLSGSNDIAFFSVVDPNKGTEDLC